MKRVRQQTKMIAMKPFRYGTRALQAGDIFMVDGSRDPKILQAIKRARPYQEREPASVAPPPENVQKSMNQLDTLREEARSLGVNVDNRWGIARLQQEIEDAIEENDEGDKSKAAKVQEAKDDGEADSES
jgi:hypothetical protein